MQVDTSQQFDLNAEFHPRNDITTEDILSKSYKPGHLLACRNTPTNGRASPAQLLVSRRLDDYLSSTLQAGYRANLEKTC